MDPARLARLDTLVAEGRIACPATVMPQWLADLTPSFDDRTSLAARPGFVQRYAELASRWHVLDAAAWRRCEARTMLAILAVAEPNDRSGSVAAVAALWRRVLAGDEPAKDEWPAAWAAAEAAAEAARDAAWAAAEAAWAAAWAAAWDTMATACLDAIENECDAAKAQGDA